MSLKVYESLEQGTDEWLEARRGVLTASVIGQLLTPSGKPAAGETARKALLQLAAERITGRPSDPITSRPIQRGNLDEPLARDYYSGYYAPVDQVGFMVLEDKDFTLGYSPDGLVANDGLIEIKSRDPKIQVSTVLADAVPKENMAQLQAGLLVSGRAWIDYVSFTAGMPLYVKRYYPIDQWQENIKAVAVYAEKTITEMVNTFNDRMKYAPETEYVNWFAEEEMF